ncbi:MAG: creatininase family protein [Deltaproteobacteria bacterium]|nr:creatininase family protein [Deltaproteobacteria bacterium]
MNPSQNKNSLESLVVFKQLHVGPVKLEQNKLTTPYKIITLSGETHLNELVYKYDEPVFNPEDLQSLNLATMIGLQVALNYGLFCKEIILEGVFDDTDKRFIHDMIENTSREIYVNKFLFDNPFLNQDFKNFVVQKKPQYTRAKINFKQQKKTDTLSKSSRHEHKKDDYIILSSGGKDSLLTYGLIKELKKTVHPVFINESGKHWFTALNTYRYFKEHDANTVRVWCNSDRIFAWFVRLMPFIRADFSRVSADIYPIRLWTVAVFIFGALPLAFARNAGRILIGDEYDSTQKSNFKGITHYNAVYDQSRYFDNTLTRYYFKKGWMLNQFSILRPTSELLIQDILTRRYPNLLALQVSCHSAHEKDGRILPCGDCEKCRRIVGMLKALGHDPALCGYDQNQITHLLSKLSSHSVKQMSAEASHLYYLLHEKNLLQATEQVKRLAKENPQIMKLRFDREHSLITEIPEDIREELLTLLSQYAKGAVVRKQNKWEETDILESGFINQPYVFNIIKTHDKSAIHTQDGSEKFMWEAMTWEEIDARLKKVDTAILPCGSIEQHGTHLPVDVDYYDIKYLAQRVAEICSSPRPFVLPAIPYGVSYHHEDFRGTLSVTNNALGLYVYDIGINLARHGIKKLILLNGHGDNGPTLNYAAQMINRDAHIFVCIESGETSDADVGGLIETPNDIHAGEIETSTTLALRPELVKIQKARDNTLNFASSYMNFSSHGVPWYVRTKRLSRTGVMGNPQKASAKKGNKIWEIIISHLVQFVEEVTKSEIHDLFQKRY